MDGFIFNQLNVYSFTLTKAGYVVNVRVIQDSKFGAHNKSDVWNANTLLQSFNTTQEALEYVEDAIRMGQLRKTLDKVGVGNEIN